MKPPLFILTGCTAVGKTEMALRWAEVNGAEIVSCDSLLFYRGLDIGTAKPTRAERARVKHHLIDIKEVSERMDITQYVDAARTAIDDIQSRGKRVLVVGGSGFYLKCFFGPVADNVAVPENLKVRVAALTKDEALAELRALNPSGLGALDVANPRRVQRALERCLAAGRPLIELAADFARQRGPFADWPTQLTEIQRPTAELNGRIHQRAAEMLSLGLVDEVRRLIAIGLKENFSASRAIGYREVIAHLEETVREVDLLNEIAKNTRALVKKQRTWFRTQLPAHRAIAAVESDPAGLFAS